MNDLYLIFLEKTVKRGKSYVLLEAGASGNAVNLQIIIDKQITYYCLWTWKMFVFCLSLSDGSAFLFLFG